MIVEVKAGKNCSGFKTLKRWMGSADALIMHEDHEESLVAIALPLFIDLLHVVLFSVERSDLVGSPAAVV